MRTYLAISTTVAFAATAIYQIYHYHNALYNDSIGHVISSPRIPAALAASTAVRIVNPQNHVPIHDTRYIKLSLPKRLTDEEILARFVKGFFGGYVFGPERGLLRANGKQITRFEALRNTPVDSHIWSAAQLSPNALPPKNSLLFGVFRVVDSDIESADASSQTYSYIDFAFGSDDGFIAGVHRFSVTCDANNDAAYEKDEKKTKGVTIEFAHSGCNPKQNKPLKPDFLQTFHLWYAMLLFREGVAEVKTAH